MMGECQRALLSSYELFNVFLILLVTKTKKKLGTKLESLTKGTKEGLNLYYT
jgi:hypothetical protein